MGRVDIVKVSILPKLTYRFNTFLVKLPAGFYRYKPADYKMYMERQKTQNDQNNFLKEQ